MSRRKRRRGNKDIWEFVSTIGSVVSLVLIPVFQTLTSYNLPFRGEYLVVLPFMILVINTVYLINNTRGVSVLAAFLFLGVGFALMVDALNTANIVIPYILTASIPIGSLQLLIVVFSGIVGAVFSR